MTSKERAERWVSGILEEKLRGQRKRARKTLRFIAEKKRGGERLTKRDVEKGMGVLCWKNLAYCCHVSKKCGFRGTLLSSLGLSEKDYTEYKEECQKLLWRFLKRKRVIWRIYRKGI